MLVLGTRGGGSGNLVEIGLADRDAVRGASEAILPIVRFDALPGRAFAGRVTRIGAAADPTTGTYQVEVALDAGRRARGRARRAVEIRPTRGAAPPPWSRSSRCSRPTAATATVYALSDDGARALRRRVAVAFIDGSRVAVPSGLDGASRVLTDGAAYLDDGAAVRVAP